MKRTIKAFTLIELMIVIVIIGILVSIALPNFIAMQDRARVSSVKSNMRAYQIMLEIYAIDFGGIYPRFQTDLSDQALLKGYAKQYKNPFTRVLLTVDGLPTQCLAEMGPGSYEPASWTGITPFFGGIDFAGQVTYRRSLPSENFSRYSLYGLDKNANFILDKDRVFVLSNG
ncbi:MAG: prepilin-type N-terminal cleavage/methylation domain-containing protein [Cyanobacteriota bacterium]